MDNCIIDDIEDLALSDEVNRYRNYIVPKISRSKLKVKPSINGQSFIPGTQSVYLKTWGCSHNNSDSEYMAGQLSLAGYYITDNKEEADLWILNSCTVKTPAEDHFRNEIIAAKKLDKYVVVAGCVPQAQPKSNYIQGISSIGVHQIDRIQEVVEETLQGHTVSFMSMKKENGKRTGGARLDLPKIRKNPLIEIIPINTGCLNQCTYCKTKHARGELGSYHPSDIVQRAIQSFEEGVVELWLTSEDLGAYGRDIDVSLPELLWLLINVTPEHAMIRLGMTNPPYILEYLEHMSEILRHPKVYSFLHIPVQSASDSVLSDMKREYSQADFREVVDYLKKSVNDLTIATDIICGFPGETEEDLKETMDLIQDYKFPCLFINQFFARPGTPAARMKKVPTDEVKRRTKLVSDLFSSYTTYDNKVGRTEDVLITDISKDKKYFIGHNKSYDQILVPMVGNFMGKKIKCFMKSSGKHFLMGEAKLPNERNWLTYVLWTTGAALLIKMSLKIYKNYLTFS